METRINLKKIVGELEANRPVNFSAIEHKDIQHKVERNAIYALLIKKIFKTFEENRAKYPPYGIHGFKLPEAKEPLEADQTTVRQMKNALIADAFQTNLLETYNNIASNPDAETKLMYDRLEKLTDGTKTLTNLQMRGGIGTAVVMIEGLVDLAEDLTEETPLNPSVPDIIRSSYALLVNIASRNITVGVALMDALRGGDESKPLQKNFFSLVTSGKGAARIEIKKETWKTIKDKNGVLISKLIPVSVTTGCPVLALDDQILKKMLNWYVDIYEQVR